MNAILEKGTTFVYSNARLLERAIFEFKINGGHAGRVIQVLSAYQNEDGGFGHALEPDLRAPDSQPLFAEFALRMLHDCGLREPETTFRLCDFLASHSDLKRGIATIFASSQKYPRAPHWSNPANQEPSMDRLVGLVGLANWQGVTHPWLEKAIPACLEALNHAQFDDAHTISTAFCLLESLPQSAPALEFFNRLSGKLLKASYFSLEAPVRGYALTPLDFAPTPESYCRGIFTQAQIEAHLDALEHEQQEDGGWPIAWQPPGENAMWEWRGHRTVRALTTLRAYGRI